MNHLTDVLETEKSSENRAGSSPPCSPDFSSILNPLPLSSRLMDPEYYIWGASMICDANGLCHLFYSRWPRETGFDAWVSHSEVAHATAGNPLGPFIHQDVALPARGAGFWDGHCTHNPTVIGHNGKYYLYYMGNTGDQKLPEDSQELNWIHRNNQRIGVAIADTPDGPWNRSDSPLIDASPAPSAPDSLLVSNPAVTKRPDGGFLMIYKAVGRQAPLPFGGPVVHMVALCDHPDGPFEKQMQNVLRYGDAAFPLEDPFVWNQNGHYFAIFKDMDRFTHTQSRSLALFESTDGQRWIRSKNSLVSERDIRFENGTTKKFDRLERPQLYLKNGVPAVLYCAVMDNDTTYNIHIPLTENSL